MTKVTTLGQFIIEKQADFPYAKGELSRLLHDIGIAAKIVNREVNKAGLMDILGNAGSTKIQGENQQKLHQRSPIFIGSKVMVEKAESLLLATNALISA